MSKKVLLLLLVLSIPSIFSLLGTGFYEPHDLHHFADIYQMYRAFESGQFPPRLGPDFTFGYGYPLFNFYYVLPFYVGAFFVFILGSVVLSFKLMFIVGIILSVFGMYFFLRKYVGNYTSFVGAILYLYTPYRFVQLYVRGAVGEVYTMALLPWVAWSIIRVVREPRQRKNVAIAGVLIALFILSHNYLWFLSFVLLSGLIIFELFKVKERVLAFKNLIFSFVLGLGVSAFWWLPALVEQQLVLSQTPFPLIDHFPFIKQLLLPSWGYGSSVWGPGDEISFQVGLVNLILVAFSVISLFRMKKRNRVLQIYYPAMYLLFGFFVLLFFMNIRSLALWQFIPFYNFIQFPWRLLFLTTFTSAILTSFVIEIMNSKRKVFVGGVVMVTAMLLNSSYMKPSNIFYKSDNDYLHRFFANRNIEGETDGVSSEYLLYSEDYLLLPVWSKKRPSNLPKAKIESVDANVFNIEKISDIHWKAKVDSDSLSTVTFNSYYFPGWIAKVNGEKVKIEPGDPYGQIEINVPKGSSSVEFKWQETPFRKKANYLSGISLIVLVAIAVIKKKTS